ncbi:MAG: MBL fold metallo-hydrolase [Phycisphaerales bacterium]|nr:MAG: MBL fold metallo-hydrolase [Phycisphaerales bacterium]
MTSRMLQVGTLVALLPSQFASAQPDFSGVELTTTHAAGTVYMIRMIEGRGGNIGVSMGEDGALLVDNQFAPLADRIRAVVKALAPGNIKFVLNTHWHGNHTGGNVEFGREATIVAHSGVRARLATEQTLLGEIIAPLPKEGLPVITFEDSVSMFFNGEEIRMIHLPNGHTDCDSVVLFKRSNVVHMGDLVFMGIFPFVDLHHGGDVLGMTRNVEQMITMLPADVKVIPGHGPLSTIDDLRSYHRMLVETTGVVQEGLKAGKSWSDIKRIGVPVEWKSWGDGVITADRWLACIYKSITKTRRQQ